MSVLRRKSWHDIARRRARSVFTVITVAVAVAGLSLFAMPPLMDRAMGDRIAEDQLHDIRLFTDDVVLDGADRAAIEEIPGVSALETRTVFSTRVHVGDRREDAWLIGVGSFDDQAVNIVAVDDGNPPFDAEVVTDGQNARSGRFSESVGAEIELEDDTGVPVPFTVSGRGDSLEFSQIAAERVVLYATQDTVDELAGTVGVNSIELTVDDPEEASRVADVLRSELLERHPDIVFTELPDVRAAGTWPGQDIFDNFSALFYVGAVLALISALILISNTMTTMIAEQRREIAMMKAIGARRRQITRSYLRTSIMLGGAGALLGTVVGVPFANMLLEVIGGRFFGIDPTWGVSVPVVVIGFAIGLLGTVLATLPALRRAARISVREGLEAGSVQTTTSPVDRALHRLPLPHDPRIGVRNVTRRKGRALGTMIQVGLAVGIALGFLALGVTVAKETANVWDSMSWDAIVIQRTDVDLDTRAGETLASIDGVAQLHPMLYNALEVDGDQYESWGIPPDTPMFAPEILQGRWLEPSDEGDAVAVFGRALAATAGLEVGDVVTVGTARGPAELEVVGIDGRLMNNGTTVYLPLSTFQGLLGRDDTNTYWVGSTSQAEGDIDSLAAAIEDQLTAAGYPVRTEIHYVEREANLAANRVLIGVLAAMGIPIVIIGMIGLVNAMTMNVIERTREVGILRSVGARSRDIRRIFRFEAIVIAALGWVLAVPLGWLIGATLSWIVTELFNFGSVPYQFPPWYPVVALVLTVLLAAVVVISPVHRAARLRPGDALRYE